MKLNPLIENLDLLIRPIVEDKGYEMYYLEFVKDDGENYLRVYIESENGISLEDCEKVSRPISTMLDEKDPIAESYYLEVSSPGLNRSLHTEKHYEYSINKEVLVRLNKKLNDNKLYKGTLVSFDNENIVLSIEDEVLSIPRDIIKAMNIEGEI
ncbi:ribosome maturation factor RimP [Clostridium algidicarnis]|uniref:ribosome maturation factor RimP n=1 Tax=Clostridium algidicarnis TaxID=37659 RepID=UPI001C0B1040|nr:ribosome maturation factor RimP [Clostridium algidicarnis]MBU3208321.1 ribosome maturation factor RimP [Clostridium algidicarnis]MBU3227447.1 ribosome maturation factor RimP [Clostridium algidicarnis]MBU3251146.1 ribosome maturation factor RimP [Clostridium algidicarnis]